MAKYLDMVNSKKRADFSSFLAFLFIVVFAMSGCSLNEQESNGLATRELAEKTKVETANSPASEPAFSPTPSPIVIGAALPSQLSFDSLIDRVATAEGMAVFSRTLRIRKWEVVSELAGENRACRGFQGESRSAIPNQAINCIQLNADLSLDEFIQAKFEEGNLFPTATRVETTLDFDGELALFVTYDSHTFFDAFLQNDEIYYWVSISVQSDVGCTIDCMKILYQRRIEEFLLNIFSINMGKFG